MIHRVYKASLKLNPNDKDFTNYIVIRNDTGVLLITENLFVVSYFTWKEFLEDVTINYINYDNKLDFNEDEHI